MKKNESSILTLNLSPDAYDQLQAMAKHKKKSIQKIASELLDKQLASQKKQSTKCPYSHVPNEELKKRINNIEKGKNLISAKDAQDLFKKLGI